MLYSLIKNILKDKQIKNKTTELFKLHLSEQQLLIFNFIEKMSPKKVTCKQIQYFILFKYDIFFPTKNISSQINQIKKKCKYIKHSTKKKQTLLFIGYVIDINVSNIIKPCKQNIMKELITTNQQPKEITYHKGADLHIALFDYYEGIEFAKENNLKQTTNFGEVGRKKKIYNLL